jgi:transcriptional regulator with XRE-family HTH domain
VRSPCDGYELAEWRCEQLADHVMKRPRKFALKHTEREALGHTNAAEFVARAAKSISTPPKGVDPATQLRYHLGGRIRSLRGTHGLTQEMLAARIDLEQKYVSQLECGQRSPSWETLVAIAHLGFELKLATLLFGIDEDIGAEMQDLSDVLAGRPKEARRDVLHAIELILRAGAGSK